MNEKPVIKAVLKFLNCYNDDENLRGYLLRKFDSSNQLFWSDTETDYKVFFPFSDSSEAISFWTNNFDKYSYLYIFATLNRWRKQWIENKELEERCYAYLGTYYLKIIQDLNSFSPRKDTISMVDILDLGLYMDNTLWIKERKTPLFIKYAYERASLNEKFYSSYGEIVHKTYSNGVFINDIHHLIDFFSATDFVTGQSLCLCSFLSAIFPGRNKNFKEVKDLGCECVPSLIKWEPAHQYLCLLLLLDFFESNSSNKNDIGVLTKSFMEKVKTELDNEKDRLSNRSAKKYESLLSKITNKHTPNDGVVSRGLRNKDEVEIVAMLQANACYFTRRRESIAIIDKEKLPLVKSVDISWDIKNVHLGQTINFKIDITKEAYNCYEKIASISRQYTIKKSFWERLLSMSGEPKSLEVTTKMDIDILKNGNSEVNNIQWNFEKIWPETDDYNYGEGIGIDSTTSIH